VSDQLQAEAIAASRSDLRPDVAAETVFAELYALIDEIEAEQSST
jgi:antitoxin StbD